MGIENAPAPAPAPASAPPQGTLTRSQTVPTSPPGAKNPSWDNMATPAGMHRLSRCCFITSLTIVSAASMFNAALRSPPDPLIEAMNDFLDACNKDKHDGYHSFGIDFSPRLAEVASSANPICQHLAADYDYVLFEKTLDLPHNTFLLHSQCSDLLDTTVVAELQHNLPKLQTSWLNEAGLQAGLALLELYLEIAQAAAPGPPSKQGDLNLIPGLPDINATDINATDINATDINAPGIDENCRIKFPQLFYNAQASQFVEHLEKQPFLTLTSKIMDYAEQHLTTAAQKDLHTKIAGDTLNFTHLSQVCEGIGLSRGPANAQKSANTTTDLQTLIDAQEKAGEPPKPTSQNLLIDLLEEATLLVDSLEKLQADDEPTTQSVRDFLINFNNLWTRARDILEPHTATLLDMPEQTFEHFSTIHALAQTYASVDRSIVGLEYPQERFMHNSEGRNAWEQTRLSPCFNSNIEIMLGQTKPDDLAKEATRAFEYTLTKAQQFASSGLIDLGIAMSKRLISISTDRLQLDQLSTDTSPQELAHLLQSSSETNGLLAQLWTTTPEAKPAITISQAPPDAQKSNATAETGLTTQPMLHEIFDPQDQSTSAFFVRLELTQSLFKAIANRTGHKPEFMFNSLPKPMQTAIKDGLRSTQLAYAPLGNTQRSQWLHAVGQNLGIAQAPLAQETPKITTDESDPQRPKLLLNGTDTMQITINATDPKVPAENFEKIQGVVTTLWQESPQFRQDFFEARRQHFQQPEISPEISADFSIMITELDNAAGQVDFFDKVEGLSISSQYLNEIEKNDLTPLMQTFVHEFSHNLQPGTAQLGYEQVPIATLGKGLLTHNRQQTLWMDQVLREIGRKEPGELHDYSSDAFHCSFAKHFEKTLQSVLRAIEYQDTAACVQVLHNIEPLVVNLYDQNNQYFGEGTHAPLRDNRMSLKDAVMQHVILSALSATEKDPTEQTKTLSRIKNMFVASARNELERQEVSSAWRMVTGDTMPLFE